MVHSEKTLRNTFLNKIVGLFRSFSRFQDKYSKIFFIILSLLLITFVCIRDLFVIEINKFIFIPVFLMAGFLLNLSSFSYFFLFSSAFFIGLPAGIILPICLFFLFCKNFKRCINSFSFLIIPVCITIIELFLNYFYDIVQINVLVQFFSTLSIICYFICFSHKELQLKKVVLFFCVGILICYLIIAIRYFSLASWAVKNKIHSGTTYNLIFTRARFGSIDFLVALINNCDLYPKTTSMHLNDNANNVAFFSIISIYMLLNIELTKKEKIFSYTMAILFIVFGLWSQSRTFLIFLALLFVYYFIFLPIITKQFGKLLLGIISMAIVVIIFVITIIFVPFVRELIARFFVSDGGGGRFDIFTLYFGKWFNSPLAIFFGYGLVSLNAATGLDMSPHTNILQVMCSYGLVGLFVLSFNTFLVLKNKTIIKKCNFVNFGPLILIIAFTLSIQSMYPLHLLYPFIPAFIFVSNECEYDNYLYKIREILSFKKTKLLVPQEETFYEINL